MKKAKLIGLMAGITALAIGAGATYAWFTSSTGPAEFTVNTAVISIESQEMYEDIGLKLPGESFGFENFNFENNSTREAVVQFSIEAVDITYDGSENEDAESVERKAELLSLLNAPGNIVITGIESGENTVFSDSRTGYKYIWLDEGENLDDSGCVIRMRVPEELGGNVGIYDEGGILISRTQDRDNEHGAVVYLRCTAYAVQGTEAAVTDIFDETIAAAFAGDYR